MATSIGVKERLVSEERAWTGDDEGAVLAAALAATLVEYRRQVRQNAHESRSDGSGHNWRMITRLEQFRGSR
jgi:hypothetical protein